MLTNDIVSFEQLVPAFCSSEGPTFADALLVMLILQ